MDSATRRDQQATCSRKKFTKEVIRAIETLELRRSNLSDEELAESAWQKLQFDLPVVEARELAALVDRLRCVRDLLALQPLPCCLRSHHIQFAGCQACTARALLHAVKQQKDTTAAAGRGRYCWLPFILL